MVAIRATQPESVAREIDAAHDHTDVPAQASQGFNENQVLAKMLHEIGDLLADQGAIAFRVQAYHNAANTLLDLPRPVREVLESDGTAGLIELPTIGRSIARLIDQYLHLGHIPLLDRLQGDETADRLFATLPSVGRELARRIHDQLEIETLPELYAASRDGRLAKVPGMGRKRVQAVRECLAERIRHHPAPDTVPVPGAVATEIGQIDRSVALSELLDVDEEYRRMAEQGKLPKIAPRKFNPSGVAWLPILHTHRDEHHYTAMYSNTARAHELNTIKDWVIIYRDDPKSHGHWTVITSQFGKLHGCRIVRGREDECLEYYTHRN
ncbi:MAG: DNA polymerase III [Pirellulaceae bacterium]|nr:DNA polymerase III [Pirellulaceae bacterium]